MTNALLIHNNNTPLKKMIDNQIVFNPTIDDLSENDIDGFISKTVMPQIKEKKFQIIYIKDNLSVNYLDFYGLILAYHIRFELGAENFVPIVILSEIDAYTINRLTPLGAILFTKNLFLVENSLSSIDKFKDLQSKTVSSDEYRQGFLNKIEIEAPKDYLSHHDISNEWAIYRWAEFLKITDSQAINQNREKIASMLYFKYLLAKNPIKIEKKNENQFVPRALTNSGKILYIDDEWANGWSDILKHYFSKKQDIKFEIFEHNFKDDNTYSVQSTITEKVKIYSPDLVILDLRLVKNDHQDLNRENISNYTGIKVLEKIKNINQGIQVLMLTATGKGVILDKLYEYNIVGYIKKEHPTDTNINIEDNFNKLKELVDSGLEKKYLKEIWEIQKSILELDLFKKDKFRQMRFEIDSVFEILNSDMEKRYIYAMLSIFQALEEINNYYIDDRTKQWIDKDSEIAIEGQGYTKQKIKAILKRLGLFEEFSFEINNISKMRKNAIHPPSQEYEKPNQKDILPWFKMLKEILICIDKEGRDG